LRHLADISTPFLVVDSRVMQRNIDRVADFGRRIGRDVRPHAKTHKCLEIARRQLAAGAVGMTVATAWEAEVFAAVTDDLLVARSVADRCALRRLAGLRACGKRLIVGIDHTEGARLLGECARAAGARFEVRIEVNTGQNRCGVEPNGALALARAIAAQPGLHLEGVFTHEGHVYSVEGPGGVHSVAAKVATMMRQVAEELRRDGHDVRSVSVGSTPALFETPKHEGMTELRPGTYVFNDQIEMLLGAADEADCAASVICTVISVAPPDQVVIDAGTKAVAADGSARQSLGAVRGCHQASFVRASEEHGVVRWPESEPTPAVGSRLEIIPYHICPAVNLHDTIVVVEDGAVVDEWPVSARGYGRLSPHSPSAPRGACLE